MVLAANLRAQDAPAQAAKPKQDPPLPSSVLNRNPSPSGTEHWICPFPAGDRYWGDDVSEVVMQDIALKSPLTDLFGVFLALPRPPLLSLSLHRTAASEPLPLSVPSSSISSSRSSCSPPPPHASLFLRSAQSSVVSPFLPLSSFLSPPLPPPGPLRLPSPVLISLASPPQPHRSRVSSDY